MRLELRGHNADVTPGLRRFVEEKLTKLERLLNDRAVSAHAILTVEKHRRIADITLHARGERFLHGLGESGNWETSLTRAIAKISHQAQKLKTRQKDTRHGLKALALDVAAPVVEAARAGRRAPAVPVGRKAARKPRS
jgi:ribosomal subunit interface protein